MMRAIVCILGFAMVAGAATAAGAQQRDSAGPARKVLQGNMVKSKKQPATAAEALRRSITIGSRVDRPLLRKSPRADSAARARSAKPVLPVVRKAPKSEPEKERPKQ